MSNRPLRLSIRRVEIGDAGQIHPAPGSIVVGVGPELAGLGSTAPGIQHWRRGLFGEQLRGALQRIEQSLMHGAQQEGGLSHPIREGRAIRGHALARIDLRLAVERQMVGVFGDQYLGDRCLSRHAAFDQTGRRRRLQHDLLATAASVLRPARDQQLELCGNDVEALGLILADAAQRSGAAGADRALDVDHPLDARQMRRQGATVGPALRRTALSLLGRGFGVLRGDAGGFDLLDLLKPEQKLLFG